MRREAAGSGARRDRGWRGLESVVGWLLAGMAVAWGLAVGGAWLDGRSWIGTWSDRVVVAEPAARPLAWRAEDRTFLVDVVARSHGAFEQWLASVEAVDPADPRLAGRAAATAPRWFRLALRQDSAETAAAMEAAAEAEARAARPAGASDGDGATPAAADPPAVRTPPSRRATFDRPGPRRAVIIETRGGWPRPVVVNRSVSFMPGITIEPMDTPSLSGDPEGRQRLPVFPLGGPLLVQGAVWGAGLAGLASTVRRAGRRRRPARAAPRAGAARGRRLGEALRLAVLGFGLALFVTWAASAAAAPRLLADLAGEVDAAAGRAVRWERTVAHGGRAHRLSVTETERPGVRVSVMRITPLETASTGLDPLPAPLRPAMAVEHGDGGDAAAAGGVVVAEVAVGWPFEAVRRQRAWPGGAAPADPAAVVGAAPPIDPAGAGLPANAVLLAAVVTAVAWALAVWMRRS